MRMKRFCLFFAVAGLFQGGVSAQLTLEGCQQAARENYPLVRQLDLIERTRDFTLENASKSWIPQLTLSGKVSYQSDVGYR